jgi:CRP-like cAMP-binding protein
MPPKNGQQIEFLQSVQIFHELSDQDLAEIADRLKDAQYPKDALIFAEGDDGDKLYLVVKGKVRVTRTDLETDEEIELGVFDSGSAFGEDALYFDRERSADAKAISDVQIYYLDKSDFNWIRANFPAIEPYLVAFIRTHEISSQLNISWLGEGEFINLITRRHPIRLFGEVGGILFSITLFITIILGLSYFLKGLESFVRILWIVGGVFSFLGFAAILWAIAEWRNDFFFVTNVRVVWRERILFRGTSRQETPLRTIQSLNIETGNFIGRMIEVGNLIVRTFNSELIMTDVPHPERMRDLIQGFILRSRKRSQREQLVEIRRTIRQKLNIEREEIPSEEPPPPPPIVGKKYGRFALFKTRIVENGTITYRKHWTVFFRQALLPNILFILSLGGIFFLSIYFVINEINGRMLIIGAVVLVTIFFFFWWLYEYEDWRNDLYRVTHDLIIDRDKKPFGKESFRSAPIKNIQSLGHEIPNIFGLIFNVGNVNINVGDQSFTFDGVHDPAVVHQDISRRMEELVAQDEQQRLKEEHERMATWLEIYHHETEDQRFPWRDLDL